MYSDIKIRIQIDHQPDARVFQFIILTFIYSRAVYVVGAVNRPDHEHSTAITTKRR